MTTTRPANSSSTPPPARTRAASAFGSGKLTETLERLRNSIDNLSSLSGLGGGGSSNLGGSSVAGMALGARAAMAPIQAMSQQIQRSVISTATAFATSMAATQRTWTKNTSRFASDFFTAMTGASQKRTSRASRSGRATRRAWQSASSWAQRRVKIVRKAARNGVQRTRKWARKATAQAYQRVTSARRSRRGGGRPGGSRFTWARRAAQGWASRTAKRWGRAGSSWAKSTRASARKVSKWARRSARSTSRNFQRWNRRVRRRAKVGWGRAGRAFSRTGSVGTAWQAGARGFLGKGGMLGLGGFGVVLTALTMTMKVMQSTFEAQNARNRPLAGYNGQIGMAFNQLALGDNLRMVQLGKATEGSAVTLARLTNQSRDIQGGFDRLNAGVSNRVASALSVVWSGLAAPYSMAADGLNNQLNAIDPKGNLLARLAASPFSAAAGIGGFLGSLWGGSGGKDALDASIRAFEEEEKNRLAGKAPTLDPFSEFIQGAKNLGPIRPMKEIRL